VGFWTTTLPTLSWHKSWNIWWTNFLTGNRPDLEVWELCLSQTENYLSIFFVESSLLSKFRRIFYCAVNLNETAWNVRHMLTADDVVIRCLTRKKNLWRTHSIINQSLCNFSINLVEYEVILRLLFLPCRRQHGVSSVIIADKMQEKGHSCGF
jgi:hypothetical protein